MKRLTSTFAFLLFLCIGLQAQSTLTVLNGSRGRLRGEILRPESVGEGQKCPIVVIMHGFTGNRNEPLLRGLSQALLERGIGSARFDFNGHGESDGLFCDMTIRNEIEDAKAIVRAVQSLPWVESVGVVGHSQGGVVASMVAGELNEGEISSVVLYAPAANIGDGCRQGNMLGTKYNPLEVPDTVNVWGRKLRRHYLDIARTMSMYETAALFRGPACIIHGEADRVVPKSCGERYAQEYRNAELHIQPYDDHGFSKNQPAAIRIGADFLKKTLKEASPNPS
jgi:pimeloyl-ACP methyl ester carboxylesterase